MEKFIVKPDITFYPGIRVDKDTKLEYKNDNVVQSIENLVFKSKMTIKTPDVKSVYNTTIQLNEGDVLVFEDDGRGYIKPVQEMYTVEQALEELNYIK